MKPTIFWLFVVYGAGKCVIIKFASSLKKSTATFIYCHPYCHPYCKSFDYHQVFTTFTFSSHSWTPQLLPIRTLTMTFSRPLLACKPQTASNRYTHAIDRTHQVHLPAMIPRRSVVVFSSSLKVLTQRSQPRMKLQQYVNQTFVPYVKICSTS